MGATMGVTATNSTAVGVDLEVHLERHGNS
jgi:hypothetical protein